MTKADFEARSHAINWARGFAPANADLFAHNSILIRAPREHVWQLLLQAERWPSWYPNAHDVAVRGSEDGTLQPGSVFTWTTFGIWLESRVHEFVENERLGWFGDAEGLNAYHTWLLAERNGQTLVVMEEVGMGPGAQAMNSADPEGMHIGHDLWNVTLKFLAESNAIAEVDIDRV